MSKITLPNLHLERHYKYLILVVLWTLLILGSLAYNFYKLHLNTLATASAAAVATVNKDISFRKWATSHGGVYVPPSERAPSNPYLKHPDRDVLTNTGITLTLMNPAYMLRDMQLHFADEYGTKTNITSLKPLNPNNIPDAWETRALGKFEQGASIVHELSDINGTPYMRLMLPFHVEPACLKCHSQQGYKIGEIRGGIATAVPMAQFYEQQQARRAELIGSHSVVWLMGLIGLLFALRRETKLNLLRQKSEQALQQSEELYHSVTDNGQALIWLAGPDKQCTFFNLPWLKFTGRTLQQEIGDGWTQGVHPDDLEACLYNFTHAFEKRSKFTMNYRLRRFDGEYRWIIDEGAPRYNAQGEFLGYIGHCLDIHDRKLAENELRVAAKVFDAHEGMFICNAKNRIIKVNHAFSQISGWGAEEVIGQSPSLFKSDRHDKAFYEALWLQLEKTGHWEGEIWNRRKNGEVYPQWLTVTAVKDEQNQLTHYVATQSDISARKQAEQQIENLAFYDPLTQLPNRRLLLDRLQHALATAKRTNQSGAILFIDLDNFKLLNDTQGHDIGDQLLQQVATRLQNSVREGDTVSRLGGDEFVVMLENLSNDPAQAASQAELVAHKVLSAMNQTFALQNRAYQSSASLGIAIFNHEQPSYDEVMKRADLAMYQAKDSGRNTFRFFDEKMQALVTARADLENELRQALHQKQFLVYYQKQVNSDKQTIGAEALVRWQHPYRGLILPTEFIPLAEETGLILQLGQWVLQTACEHLAEWGKQPESAQLYISVNVSAHQFVQADFVETVLQTLAQTGANPKCLKLELTESVFAANLELIIEKMTVLKQQGISFSLDDFGTGYSSLSYLKLLPLDQLKIDQGFVRDILIDPNDAAIAKMVIALAKSMDLNVIAEGVETAEQHQALEVMGCQSYQGFYFAHPEPADTIKMP